ncbi:HAMP domain-containing sensor histidine kinase [Desulfomonile tiedjei]|uniref:histidine kinase n=1 Tax=Desulfomonile tiedjei (strain ATCC 49306 / DSM 6799 / DCB-1) TaxID=706587 RepID=I4C4T3_DESTA|nr:ATP-binding protein [Desulfomonile tiedjei]AFM24574.1 signal transduction histidine kinase [Desulfomonile tiedjei DSM 6799]
MLGIRQKLSLGFAGLLAIILIIGGESISLFSRLGDSIDVILRENYRSVVACLEMKEALERMDSGLLFLLLRYDEQGTKLIAENRSIFEKALQIEVNNVTLPGEGEKARKIQNLYSEYKSTVGQILQEPMPLALKRQMYFERLLPLFGEIKKNAGDILEMNQQNMIDANDQARGLAASARWQMYGLLAVGCILAMIYIILVRRWIFRPITRLIQSTNEISAGNLDLVVKTESQDEIGQLSESFNAMAESLRRVRRTREAKLAQIQQMVQEAFRVLPEAVAIVNLQGRVEMATQLAGQVFGLRPTAKIQDLQLDWLNTLFHNAIIGQDTSNAEKQHVVQSFVNDEERYFAPKAVVIRGGDKEVSALLIVINDITQQRQQDELKRGVLSTVSHQLKTPLTSIRMAIHLLLEGDIGSPNEKQADVLMSAEQEAERLHRILENLLDIGRIESGKVYLNLQSLSPYMLVLDSVEPFRSASQDQGIHLNIELPEGLPEVLADPARVPHVFSNLLANALKYTHPGGRITVSAITDEEFVRFSVADTGRGIPAQYHENIFEQFFRAPIDATKTGIGLGLSIAKEIVEAHGGTISVNSSEGEGSTFTFSLRRSDSLPKE